MGKRGIGSQGPVRLETPWAAALPPSFLSWNTFPYKPTPPPIDANAVDGVAWAIQGREAPHQRPHQTAAYQRGAEDGLWRIHGKGVAPPPISRPVIEAFQWCMLSIQATMKAICMPRDL